MRWLLFLSRICFICGFFFLLALSLLMKGVGSWTDSQPIIGTVGVIGYFFAFIIVPVTNLCYLIVFLVKRKLRVYVPTWLIIANFLFLLIFIFYLSIPHDQINP